MTDNVLDGTVPGGTGGQPTQPVSPGATGADSTGEVTLADVLKDLKELQGQVRSLQGSKDKAVHRVQAEVNGLTEQLKRYEDLRAKGVSQEDALFRMEVEDEILARKGGNPAAQAPQQATAGSPSPAAGVDYTDILTSMGLDANNPEVVKAIANAKSPIETIQQFTLLARARTTQTPITVTNPAPLPGAGGAAAGDTLESLTAELVELQKSPLKNMEKIRAVMEKQKVLLPKG